MNLYIFKSREKGEYEEDLANEIRRSIGCIWSLRGSVACFHELYSQPNFLMTENGGFHFVDLKCAENNCVVTPIFAFFETKLFDLFSSKIYKIKTTPLGPCSDGRKFGWEVEHAKARDTAVQQGPPMQRLISMAKSSLSTPFSLGQSHAAGRGGLACADSTASRQQKLHLSNFTAKFNLRFFFSLSSR